MPHVGHRQGERLVVRPGALAGKGAPPAPGVIRPDPPKAGAKAAKKRKRSKYEESDGEDEVSEEELEEVSFSDDDEDSEEVGQLVETAVHPLRGHRPTRPPGASPNARAAPAVPPRSLSSVEEARRGPSGPPQR